MTLIDHLPILVVLVPLFVAPFLAIIPNRGPLPWLIALVASLITFCLAIAITSQVLERGSIAYELGNWPVPFGIGLLIGPFSALMLLVISGASLAALAWGRASMNAEVDDPHQALLYSCWLLALAGLIGITVTGDAFNVFVFMEISSLAAYVMVANGPKRQALTASFKYLITGTLGATFYLIGVGYLYMMTGTLNLADMAVRVGEVADTMPVLIASGFLITGLALKAAIFPMHAWMPNTYQFAPTPVTVFFAACSTKVALFVLMRFDFLVLQPNLSDHSMLFSAILIPLAVTAFLVGSVVAVFERDLKRMLGYSSVAQIGYIVLAASLVTTAGTTAAIVHMFNHALMKSALFMAVGVLVLRFGSSKLDDLAGAGKLMPLTMLAFVLAGLSLIGVPLTAGFISKWFLIQALLETGTSGVVLTILVLISSLLAVVYIWKVVEIAYFREPSESLVAKCQGKATEAPLMMMVVLGLLVAANFWFGLDSTLPVSLGQMEATSLMAEPTPGVKP